MEDFEDVRIDRETFDAMKAGGDLPYGQVPALDVGNGTLIAQSRWSSASLTLA